MNVGWLMWQTGSGVRSSGVETILTPDNLGENQIINYEYSGKAGRLFLSINEVQIVFDR